MYISSSEIADFRGLIRSQQQQLDALLSKLASWGGKGRDVSCQTDGEQVSPDVLCLELEGLSDCEGSMRREGSTSLDNTMRSCMATPRRIENERLRVIEGLRKMEWDTEVQFVGSADDFTESECRQVYIVVTLATFYKVTSDGTVLYEIGSECIISIEIFDDTQFISIGTTDDTDQLLYLHADAKSTSSLRLLDVINEFFLEIPTIHSPSMDRHMNDLIKEYQRNRPQDTDVRRKVNLKDDLKDFYVYTVEEEEIEEADEESSESTEDEGVGNEADQEGDGADTPAQGETHSRHTPSTAEALPVPQLDASSATPEAHDVAPPPSPLVSSGSTFSSTPETGKRSIRSSIRRALQVRFGRPKQTHSQHDG